MTLKQIDKDKFIFNGFFPNDNLQEKCRNFYHLVETRSPNASAKEASITKVGDDYEAKIKIISDSCNFEVSSKDNEPIESIDKLSEKFLNQILNWNQERDLF